MARLTIDLLSGKEYLFNVDGGDTGSTTGGTVNFIPLSNTCYVNHDLVEDDVENRVFNAYDSAITWIQTNQVLSETNQWQIMLPSGTIPIVTIYEFIKINGGDGTVINELRSSVSASLIPSEPLKTANLSNCRINNLNVGEGNIIVLISSLVENIIDSVSYIVLFETIINGGLVENTIFLESINSQLVGVGGSLNIWNATNLSVNNNVDNIITDITLWNMIIGSNFSNFSGGTYNIDLVDDTTLINTSIDNGMTVVIPDNVILKTINCSGGFKVSGNGTWDNVGSKIDASKFSGNLDSTIVDTQSLANAVDALEIPLVDDTVTKTSDLQNDSNFITSSSLTKANIEGLKDTDSPTFADTLIPALADPASYDPATVAYLTELFGELSDSVKESILRTWGRLQDITNKVAGLQESTNNETTHKSSAISHGLGSVEDRLDNITDGVITKDANDDILSMMTFGETTVFNRDVNGDIESWENDTHVWTLTKTNGEIIGWTLTEKP